MAGPTPPLRNHRLDLVTLSAMARTFDQISRVDGGQLWPATAFVKWLADEWRASQPGRLRSVPQSVPLSGWIPGVRLDTGGRSARSQRPATHACA
jgi:hypothetical protein